MTSISGEEELEALLSVWDDIVVIRNDDKRGDLVLRKECLPRSNQQFVSVLLELHVPASYPSDAPTCTAVRSTGLDDDAAAVVAECNAYLKRNTTGEPILFQFYDYVHDCLDNCSSGTCLICSVSLTHPGTGTGTDKGAKGSSSSKPRFYSIRTECLHCYHLHCIVRWGAISVRNQENSKDKRREREATNVGFRTLEGQVKMNEKMVESLQTTLTMLALDIQNHEAELDQQLVELTKDVDADIIGLQTALTASTNEIKRGKPGSKPKPELTQRLESLKATIADREKARDLIVVNHKSARSPIKTAIDTCRKSVTDTKEKLARAEAKVQQAQAELATAMSQEKERKHTDAHHGWHFPCPNCRVSLNNVRCLPADTAYFDELMRAELALVADGSADRVGEGESAGVVSSGSATAAASMIANGTVTASVSVSVLPPEIQEYVRSVQRFQQTLRDSLKAAPDANDKSQQPPPSAAIDVTAAASASDNNQHRPGRGAKHGGSGAKGKQKR